MRRPPIPLCIVLATTAAWAAPPIVAGDAAPTTYGETGLGDHPWPACWSTDDVVPLLEGPYHHGDTMLRVARGEALEAGETFVGYRLYYDDTASGTPQTYNFGYTGGYLFDALATNGFSSTPAPASIQLEDVLPASLLGNQVEVQPAPMSLEVLPPVALGQFDGSARAVQVGALYPGAHLELLDSGGTVIGERSVAGRQTARVSLPASAVAGDVFTLRQTVAGVSATSTFTITAGSDPVRTPRGFPAEDGDTSVWVSNVAPGSDIDVVRPSTVWGSARTGGSLVEVPTCEVFSGFDIEATRAGATQMDHVSTQPRLEAGPFPATQSFGFVPYTSVPTAPAACVSNSPGAGAARLNYEHWVPAGWQSGDPVIFMMHGNSSYEAPDCCEGAGNYSEMHPSGFCVDTAWGADDSFSYYEYLGDYLSSLGFRFVSFAVCPVDLAYAVRLNYYDEFISAYLAQQGIDSTSPLVLMGHSMGGQAAFARADSVTAPNPVVGAIGLAPAITSTLGQPATPRLIVAAEEDFAPSQTDLSADRYMAGWAENGFYVMVSGASHAYFNECWTRYTGELSETAQRDQTLRYVHQFLAGVLGNNVINAPDPRYLHKLRGPAQPRGDHSARNKYWARLAPSLLIDSFGDGNAAAGVAAESRADPAVNDLGFGWNETGSGAANETSPSSLATTMDTGGRLPGSSRMLHLRWSASDYFYQQRIGTAGSPVAVSPTDLVLFDALNLGGTQSTNRPFLPTDFVVALRDSDGDIGRVNAGLGNRLWWPFVDEGDPAVERHIFESVALPADAFQAQNPDLDLNALTHIGFEMSIVPQGDIAIDNLMFIPAF